MFGPPPAGDFQPAGLQHVHSTVEQRRRTRTGELLPVLIWRLEGQALSMSSCPNENRGQRPEPEPEGSDSFHIFHSSQFCSRQTTNRGPLMWFLQHVDSFWSSLSIRMTKIHVWDSETFPVRPEHHLVPQTANMQTFLSTKEELKVFETFCPLN